MKTRLIIVAVLALASSGCKSKATAAFAARPIPKKFMLSRVPLDLCNLAEAPILVEAEIEGWNPPRYEPIEGVNEKIPSSEVSLRVLQAIKGNVSGQIKVEFPFGVDENGEHVDGNIGPAGASRKGLLFLDYAGDKLVLWEQGLLLYSDSANRVSNRTKYRRGVASTEVVRNALNRGNIPCPSPWSIYETPQGSAALQEARLDVSSTLLPVVDGGQGVFGDGGAN